MEVKQLGANKVVSLWGLENIVILEGKIQCGHFSPQLIVKASEFSLNFSLVQLVRKRLLLGQGM